MKSKLERSRQSARECRARKKLRYQYLDDLILVRSGSPATSKIVSKVHINKIIKLILSYNTMYLRIRSRLQLKSKRNLLARV